MFKDGNEHAQSNI